MSTYLPVREQPKPRPTLRPMFTAVRSIIVLLGDIRLTKQPHRNGAQREQHARGRRTLTG
jgi:hypothetical protein